MQFLIDFKISAYTGVFNPDWRLVYVQSLGHDLRVRFGCYKVSPVDFAFEQFISWCPNPDKMARDCVWLHACFVGINPQVQDHFTLSFDGLPSSIFTNILYNKITGKNLLWNTSFFDRSILWTRWQWTTRSEVTRTRQRCCRRCYSLEYKRPSHWFCTCGTDPRRFA